ncbi:HEPN domain-containing protein [Actinobacillus minor]|uniref:HEPN domain-containing protein n=1 Tax=Actinobacillus minor TaxID=51047 RepID=UPI0026EF0A50|nr:HEPN domain-containing protein [Actinobacillus minor]
MKNDNSALGYWSMGQRFLKTSSLIAKEIVNSGNDILILSDKPLSEAEYDKQTKWNERNVAIPALFNFYHGIELMLKGFLSFHKENSKGHKFSQLLERLVKIIPNEDEFINLIKSYTCDLQESSIVAIFNNDNSIDIDEWYQSLKYPESTKGKEYIHTNLMYAGSESLEFWETLAKDSIEIIRLSRKYDLENKEF